MVQLKLHRLAVKRKQCKPGVANAFERLKICEGLSLKPGTETV